MTWSHPINTTTSTSGSGTAYTWTWTPPARRTRLVRFAGWYWTRFVLETGGERCLCKIGLGRLCGWLEDHAQ